MSKATPIWVTADGRRLRIDEMGTEHIQNASRILEKMRKGHREKIAQIGDEPDVLADVAIQRARADIAYCDAWIGLFDQELVRRTNPKPMHTFDKYYLAQTSNTNSNISVGIFQFIGSVQATALAERLVPLLEAITGREWLIHKEP